MNVHTAFQSRLLLAITALVAGLALIPLAFATPTHLWSTDTLDASIVGTPWGIAVRDDGYAYIVGSDNDDMGLLSPDGTSLGHMTYGATLSSSSTRKIVGTGSTFYMAAQGGGNGRLYKFQVSGDVATVVASSGATTGVLSIAMSDNGILYFSKANNLFIVDRTTLLPLSRITLTSAPGTMATNADGSLVYYITAAGVLRRIDPNVGSASDTSLVSGLGTSSLLAIDGEENLFVLTTAGTLRKYSSGAIVQSAHTPTGGARYGTGAIVIKDDTLYSLSTAGRRVVAYNLDETPPPAAGDFTATVEGNDVHLTWTNPDDEDFYATTLVRSTERFATSVDDPVGGGVAPFEHETFESYDDEGLEDGTYYYTLFSEDAHGNASSSTYSVTVDVTPPEAPTLEATADGTNVQLSWNVPAGTDTFMLRRSSVGPVASVSSGSLINASLASSITDYTYHAAEGTYYFGIFARDGAGNYSEAGQASVTIDVTPPMAPSMFAASVDVNDIHLTWTNPVDDFAAVRLQRSTGGYPISVSDGFTVFVNQTFESYYDSDREDGTYYYGLFARDAAGNYSVAATVSATVDTTSPATPAFSATAVGDGVELSWDVPATTDSFVIRWSADATPANPSAGSLLATLASSFTGYTHSGRSPGTYYYAIFARDAVGNVSNGGNASATVAASSSSSGPSGEPQRSQGGGGGRGHAPTTVKPPAAATAAHPAAQSPASEPKPAVAPTTKERVCKRVTKRTSPLRLKLVNARLQKWLGFSCQ